MVAVNATPAELEASLKSQDWQRDGEYRDDLPAFIPVALLNALIQDGVLKTPTKNNMVLQKSLVIPPAENGAATEPIVLEHYFLKLEFNESFESFRESTVRLNIPPTWLTDAVKTSALNETVTFTCEGQADFERVSKQLTASIAAPSPLSNPAEINAPDFFTAKCYASAISGSAAPVPATGGPPQTRWQQLLIKTVDAVDGQPLIGFRNIFNSTVPLGAWIQEHGTKETAGQIKTCPWPKFHHYKVRLIPHPDPAKRGSLIEQRYVLLSDMDMLTIYHSKNPKKPESYYAECDVFSRLAPQTGIQGAGSRADADTIRLLNQSNLMIVDNFKLSRGDASVMLKRFHHRQSEGEIIIAHHGCESGNPYGRPEDVAKIFTDGILAVFPDGFCKMLHSAQEFVELTKLINSLTGNGIHIVWGDAWKQYFKRGLSLFGKRAEIAPNVLIYPNYEMLQQSLTRGPLADFLTCSRAHSTTVTTKASAGAGLPATNSQTDHSIPSSDSSDETSAASGLQTRRPRRDAVAPPHKPLISTDYPLDNLRNQRYFRTTGLLSNITGIDLPTEPDAPSQSAAKMPVPTLPLDSPSLLPWQDNPLIGLIRARNASNG